MYFTLRYKRLFEKTSFMILTIPVVTIINFLHKKYVICYNGNYILSLSSLSLSHLAIVLLRLFKDTKLSYCGSELIYLKYKDY